MTRKHDTPGEPPEIIGPPIHVPVDIAPVATGVGFEIDQDDEQDSSNG
ncbi:hypothetical protein AB0I53_25175 [Saccharopolyspora sp. NPDC050389]